MERATPGRRGRHATVWRPGPSMRASGCHCTARTKRLPGSFQCFDDAVGRPRPRPAVQARERRRTDGGANSPGSGPPPVWKPTGCRARWRPHARPAPCAGCAFPRAASACPPSAALSNCRPRQMANTGRSRRSASRSSAHSTRSRSVSGLVRFGMPKLAVKRRLHIRPPPAKHSPRRAIRASSRLREAAIRPPAERRGTSGASPQAC